MTRACACANIAAQLGVTERSAYGIVSDLTAAGYVVKDKEGRRNRYEIQRNLPLRDAIGRERTIGEVLEILVEPSVPVLAQGGRQRVSVVPKDGSVVVKRPASVSSARGGRND